MWLALKIRLSNLFNGPEDTVRAVFHDVIENTRIHNTAEKIGCINWLQEKHWKLMMLEFDSRIASAHGAAQQEFLRQVRRVVARKLGIPANEEMVVRELLVRNLPLSALSEYENFYKGKKFSEQEQSLLRRLAGKTLEAIAGTKEESSLIITLQRRFLAAIESSQDGECKNFYRANENRFREWKGHFQALDIETASADDIWHAVHSCVPLRHLALAYLNQPSVQRHDWRALLRPV